MGKRLSDESKLEILKLLKKGYTSAQCAEIFEISSATINNLRLQFKKDGEVFPDNRGRRKRKEHDAPRVGNKVDGYNYIIDGVQINFIQKPKFIRIGKNGFFVDFD